MDLNKPVFKLFPHLADAIKEGKCPSCFEVIKLEDFKSDINRKEFEISGMW